MRESIGIPNGIGGVGFEDDVPDPCRHREAAAARHRPRTPTEDDIAGILTRSVRTGEPRRSSRARRAGLGALRHGHPRDVVGRRVELLAVPIGVATPRDAEDVAAAVAVCREHDAAAAGGARTPIAGRLSPRWCSTSPDERGTSRSTGGAHRPRAPAGA
jgi:hypothetical protein